MARFYEDDASEFVNTDDFGFTITSGSTTFSAIFEYAYGEQFGFDGREVPTLTATTSSVSSVAVDASVTVPADAIPTSSSAKTFKIMVKKPDNSGMTVLVLEAN